MSPESALAARDAAGLADEAAPALIGPHAVIHLAEVMREDFGPVACDTVLAHAQIDAVPGGTCMIPEIEALRLHRWMAVWDPVACFGIAEEAGRGSEKKLSIGRRRCDFVGPAACEAPCGRACRRGASVRRDRTGLSW